MTFPVPFDPARPPDWRWQAAAPGGGRRGRGPRDPAARAVGLYRAAWAASATAADRRAAAARHPVLAAAHALARDGGLLRAAVEARVLADQPPAEIARAGGHPPGVVEAYEAVFFDVRPALGAPDYIRARVLEAARGGRPPGPVWRLLGYLGGPAVLDAVIGERPAGPPPAAAAGADAFLAAEAAAAARRRLALTAWAGGDPAALGRLLRDLGGAEGSPQTVIDAHVRAMLEEIPWAFGTAGPAAERPDLAPYDGGAGELRDEELLRAAGGRPPPGLEEHLAGLCLPPPRPRGSVLMGSAGGRPAPHPAGP